MITALLVFIAIAVVVQILCASVARSAADRAEAAAYAALKHREYAEETVEAAVSVREAAEFEARKAQR